MALLALLSLALVTIIVAITASLMIVSALMLLLIITGYSNRFRLPMLAYVFMLPRYVLSMFIWLLS